MVNSKYLFCAGEMVIIFDRRERSHLFKLEENGVFESHIGILDHSKIIGSPEGSWFKTTTGHWMIGFRPTRSEYSLNMPRIATVTYPKDMGAILTYANVFNGAQVLEAGTGSGALAISISNLIGIKGHLYTYDIRADMSELAKKNAELYSSTPTNITFKTSDITNTIEETDIDCVILDLPEPWEAIPNVYKCLKPGGIFLTFLPTIIQVSDTVKAMKTQAEFTLIKTIEIMEREWSVGGRSIRPSHRMVGHTGFITTARKCFSREYSQ